MPILKENFISKEVLTLNKNSSGNQNVFQLVLIGLLIGAAFFIGMLWTKVRNMEGSAGAAANNVKVVNNDNPSVPVPADNTAKDLDPIASDDHIQGSKDAKIVLVEYSDFDCPFCKRFHLTAKQAKEEYGDTLAWVYRHFPLDQLHPDARAKAEASECVAKLGGNDAFWKFADMLSDPAVNVTVDRLATKAAEMGVDSAAFTACFNSGEMKDAVNSDYQSGIRAGVSGTPGNILLNTETGDTLVLRGAVPYESLKQSIDSMLE